MCQGSLFGNTFGKTKEQSRLFFGEKNRGNALPSGRKDGNTRMTQMHFLKGLD